MDRMVVVSTVLFFVADIFAIISLAMPHWIVTKVGGETALGLVWTCVTLTAQPKLCFSATLAPEWLLTLLLVFVGSVCVTSTVVLLLASAWDTSMVGYARWLGFAAMIMFCLAAVIFPLGFSMSEIGGEAYQLPNGYDVGWAYIFFVLALWITVVSELFAGKVCLPHLISGYPKKKRCRSCSERSP